MLDRSRSILLISTLLIARCSCGDDAPSPTGLRLEPDRITMNAGDSFQLTATLTFADGHEEDATARATFTSADIAVATVAPGGTVTGTGKGATTITAAAGGLTASAAVTVADRNVESLFIHAPPSSILTGGSAQLALFGAFDDGTVSEVTMLAEWSSASDAIATVASGEVTGVAAGEATIHARYRGAGAQVRLRVGLNRFTSSPHQGEADVAVMRETIVQFEHPLAPSVTPSSDDLFAEHAGARIPARLHFSADRRRLSLFYPDPLPASARVRVTLTGDRLLDAGGAALDADGDGTPGGRAHIDFDTLSLTLVEGTAVYGRVFATELSGDGASSVNTPLAGVLITVDGLPPTELSATTDTMGNFRLEPAPAGRFFVHIDGRNVMRGSDGSYYPVVSKAWTGVPETEVAIDDIYLPRIAGDTITLLNPSGPTMVSFPPSVTNAHPELAGVRLVVPQGALFADDGTTGGGVGMAPVPPDRLPSPMPPGLGFPLVITVQTDGATNFDVPIEACFPNRPSGGVTLPPGAPSSIFSFNHDKGRFEVVAPARVSEDGTLVCTLPGTGLTSPGWHAPDPDTEVESEPDSPQRPRSREERPPRDGRSGGGSGGGGGPSCPDLEASGFWESSAALGLCLQGYVDASEQIERVADRYTALQSVVDAALVLIAGLDASSPPQRIRDFHAQFLRERNLFLLRSMEAGDVSEPLAAIDCALDAQGQLEAMCELLAECPDEDVYTFEVQAVCEYLPTARATLVTYSEQLEAIILLMNSNLLDQLTDLLSEAEALLDQATEGALRPAVLDDALLAKMDEIEAALQMLQGPAISSSALTSAFDQSSSLLAAADRAEFGAIPNVYVRTEVGGFVQRFQGDANGHFQVFLPASTNTSFLALDPRTLRCGAYALRTPASGQVGRVRMSAPGRCGDTDADGDGVTDLGESIVGTSPDNADSDGDGIGDGAELRSGTDPLDGIAVRTGILASTDTPGDALDVCASESIVAVADESSVRVYNAYRGLQPILIAAVPVDGTVARVACDGLRVAATIHEGTRGLVTIDLGVSPPAVAIHPYLARRPVAMQGGMVLFASDASIHVADFATGIELSTWPEPVVDDLAFGTDAVYALSGSTLQAYALETLSLSRRGSAGVSADSPPTERRLFTGVDRAWAVHLRGYDVYDLTDPLQPLLIPGSTQLLGWRDLDADGAGLGVAAAGPNSPSDQDVLIYDISDDARTDVLLATIETPGTTSAVVLHEGLAYAADGDSGLQVINYRAAEVAGGAAPQVAVQLSRDTLSPGELYTITAAAIDETAVRNVELFVDDEVVATLGSYPFRRLLPSPLALGTHRVRARVFDRAGNAASSDEATLTVVMDTTGPEIGAVLPDGSTLVTTLPANIRVVLNERIDTRADASAVLRLTDEGGTSIALASATLSNTLNSGLISAVTAGPLPLGRYTVEVGPPLADLSGNLAALQTASFDVVSASSGELIITVNTLGVPANGFGPSISADGRLITFHSRDADLVPADGNGVEDVFLHDIDTNSLTQLTAAADGDSSGSALSADGRFVAFTSLASNLVANDTNFARDAFVLDRMSGAVELVSLDAMGNQLPNVSMRLAISPGGRYVAFALSNPGNPDARVFRRDRMTATSEDVGILPDGTPIGAGYVYAVSDLGTVAWTRAYDGIYVRDPDLGTTIEATIDAGGTFFTSNTNTFCMSADGTRFLYAVGSTIYARTVGQVATQFYGGKEGNIDRLSCSEDGLRLILRDSRATRFLDRSMGTNRQDLDVDPSRPNLVIAGFAISADGTTVAVNAEDTDLSRYLVYRVPLP